MSSFFKKLTLLKGRWGPLLGALVVLVALAALALMLPVQEAPETVAPKGPEASAPLPSRKSFALINQDGKTVRDTDFAGKYLLIYFGYTSCPDMCPTGLSSISHALDQLGKESDKVQPLFITVDPARDTPTRLKEYDASFHPKIIGLTGTEAQIAAAAKAYDVYYKKGEGEEEYEVDHSSLIYLVDPSGALMTTFDEEVAPTKLTAALRKAWKAAPTFAR